MEDDEIRDIMARLKHPDMILEFRLERYTRKNSDSAFPGQRDVIKRIGERESWSEFSLKVALKK